jgi:hypothetical protein
MSDIISRMSDSDILLFFCDPRILLLKRRNVLLQTHPVFLQRLYIMFQPSLLKFGRVDRFFPLLDRIFKIFELIVKARQGRAFLLKLFVQYADLGLEGFRTETHK